MKKRNQLVSTLLAGVLVSGAGAAALSSAPVLVTAEEADLQADGGSEGQEEVDYEEPTGEDADYSEMTEAGAETVDSFPENPGTQSTAAQPPETSVPVDSGTENIPEGGSAEDFDSFAENVEPESFAEEVETEVLPETVDSDAESMAEPVLEEPEDTADGDAGAPSEEELKRAAEEARAAEEEKKRLAEQEEQARLVAEEEALAEEEARLAEEEEKRKADEEAKLEEAEEASRQSAYREYYTGTYIVSDQQRRLALNVGFRKIPKKYAVACELEAINIYEGKGDGARVVGTLDPGALCYVIDDEKEPWVYVESGDVRGFVSSDSIATGKLVNKYVRAAGEDRLKVAVQTIDTLQNAAYRYSLYTTKNVTNLLTGLEGASVNRQNMIQYSMQFLGNPYVWGGESLTQGCDCSGFTMLIYRQFGIELPRCSYEQAEVGVKIPVQEALPGDLVFYARDGAVYHVLMAIGDGKAINASSSTTGIIISDINLQKACWAVRIFDDGSQVASTDSSTQADDFVTMGRQAYQGDLASKQAIIDTLAKASEKEWQKYGFCRSVIIAQAIQETGWGAFSTSDTGIQASDNNVLGMNEELRNGEWVSPWTGGSASRLVPQYSGGSFVYGFETMRTYEDIESCMEDYAAFKIGLHPELRGVTDVDTVISIGLKGYATDPTYQNAIKRLIDEYNLDQFDVVEGLSEGELSDTGDAEMLLQQILYGDTEDEYYVTSTESGVESAAEPVLTESAAEPLPEEIAENSAARGSDNTESQAEDLADSDGGTAFTVSGEDRLPDDGEGTARTEDGQEEGTDSTAEEVLAEESSGQEHGTADGASGQPAGPAAADTVTSDAAHKDGRRTAAGEDSGLPSSGMAAAMAAENLDAVAGSTAFGNSGTYSDADLADYDDLAMESAQEGLPETGEDGKETVKTAPEYAYVAADEAAEGLFATDGVIAAAGLHPAAVHPSGDVLYVNSPNVKEITGAPAQPGQAAQDGIAGAAAGYAGDYSDYRDADADTGMQPDYADMDDYADYTDTDNAGDGGDGTDADTDGWMREGSYAPEQGNGNSLPETLWSGTPQEGQDGLDGTDLTEASPDTVDHYDPVAELHNARADYTEYSDTEMQKIWAIVASEDDTCYDGALAVISAAMNRADVNYGGYGLNAYGQLTAPGQHKADYSGRLGGNVPDFVKQAVSDCLTGGLRNHSFTDFRYDNLTGQAASIGANWYYN